MIGVQSSVIMFPINLLIVSIFRNTRSREKDSKADSFKQGKTGQVSPSHISSPYKELKDITPDTLIKVTFSDFSDLTWNVTVLQSVYFGRTSRELLSHCQRPWRVHYLALSSNLVSRWTSTLSCLCWRTSSDSRTRQLDTSTQTTPRGTTERSSAYMQLIYKVISTVVPWYHDF